MTYSIVARDKDTGELGVAVQSHYFQVGPIVPWALAGVGAVATQSRANVAFGPLGLDLLKAGYSAENALKALIAGDPLADERQCAIVDASGAVAVHTGKSCIPAAGHVVGDGFSCQANLMEKETVWDAMAEAFKSSGEPLAERMMAALDVAEAEGGDIRGKQSAAMLVVTGNPTGRSWDDRLIDIRVEDSAEPLPDLRRLLRLRRAYQASSEAAELAESGDLVVAAEKLRLALELAPEVGEFRFWAGVEMARGGALDAGCEMLAEVIRMEGARWVETLRRLVPVGRISPELCSAIEARLAATTRAK
ncbi:MAG TPA: DUF1028 domain-containing protein [Candidatus Dormibacteraeota bacterium]